MSDDNQSRPTAFASDYIGTPLQAFLAHVGALNQAFPFVRIITEGMAAVEHHKFSRFLETHCKRVPNEATDADSATYQTMDRAISQQVKQLEKRATRSRLGENIIPKAFVVMLVSHFDTLIGNLIRAVYSLNPQRLLACNHSFNYAELAELDSIDQARELLIARTVDNVLRDSHTKQIEWFEKALDIPLRKDLAIWPTFIELTERRNLFVHADGVVSDLYLRICGQHDVKLPDDIKRGDKLSVTPDYFQTASDSMVEIGVKLAHVIWRKVASDERDAADSDINQICYELILNQEYKLAAEILCFASEDVFSKHSTAERRLAFQFNLAQCYKWIGNETACRNIIEKVDCSALDMRFQICHAVLRDDFNTALRVFNATGTSGSLTKEDYETWPIFNKLRERPEFLEAFRVLFGQELRKLKDFEIKLEREIQREFVPQPHPALPADESTPADLRSPG